jgi:hypothetical protein
MQIKGELQDERDERFHTDSLQTRANAVNDGSNHDYDKDRFNGLHEVKQEGQPRDSSTRRYSERNNDQKEDAANLESGKHQLWGSREKE